MKALMSAMVLMVSLSSFAQTSSERSGGFRNNTPSTSESRIDIGGGRSTLRINVYNNNELDQNIRIRRLEQAVMDLQNQVYDIREQQQPVVIRVTQVTIRTIQDMPFVGEGNSESQAEMNARSACNAARAPFCSTARVTRVETVDKVVRY